MARAFLIVWGTAAATGLVAVAVFMGIMMTSMMGGGHMGMMGQGSNPAGEAPVEGVTQVRIENFAFAPANIVVDAGTTVTWTNYDALAHSVKSDEGDELQSGLFGQDGTFSRTFDEPGEYYYHCEPHPNMKGLVTVRAGSA